MISKANRGILMIGVLIIALLGTCCIILFLASALFPASRSVSTPGLELAQPSEINKASFTLTTAPTGTPIAPTHAIETATETPQPPTLTPTEQPATTNPVPTQSDEEILYAALTSELDETIIRGVRISARDLEIKTRLTRSDMQLFYEDIGAIHGVVVREDLDVDRVILDDIAGQQIIMPMDAMKQFYVGSIDWDTFRSTWTVINP
jgi:hypothetical protein